MSDVEAAYLAAVEPEIRAGEAPFRVQDDQAADWALRKLAALQQAQAERAAFVSRETQRLRDWQHQLDQRDAAEVAFFSGLLEAYYRALQAAGKLGRRKGYPLPRGTLTVQPLGVKWTVDPEALLRWAQSRGLTRTRTEPAWNLISARLTPEALSLGARAIDTQTGEVVDAVRLERLPGEQFKVKLVGEKGEGQDGADV